ncbi:uncharacterized protein LOC124263876 isoform X2 [Haliotis rubra]|uniref:uncharacterized protein LOC124263876 isoform X2 n=1 Tax=Haliotis rubra TaxID=36100 RepID=UPI001EE53E04|nr:uncharacterized protein LOC124263876 isoform X2 [Haliotis rubra]
MYINCIKQTQIVYFQVPPEQFEQAMDVIRSSSCICRHCYDNVPCCVFFLVCLLLTGLVIMPTIVILVMVSPIPAPPGFPVFILMTSLPWILFITIYFAQRLVIRFWFYDASECKTMLAAFLEERHGGADAGAFQACASRLIQQYSGEYTSCYLQG